MVPFMLGRPLGEPNDGLFQRRVLLQTLRFLERTNGPVILGHFPDDNPSWFDRPNWVSGVSLPIPDVPHGAAAWEAAFRTGLEAVLPAWERFKARFGRSTGGRAGQTPEAWPAFATSFLNGALPTVPLHDTPALALRFLADDRKALYGEAVRTDGEPPSVRQIDQWFWRRTVAGQLLIILRGGYPISIG